MKRLKVIVTVIFLSLMVFGMTSCVVRVSENNGRHRGWFHKNDIQHRDRKVYFFKHNDHKQPSSPHDNRPKGRSKDNNRWDAKK